MAACLQISPAEVKAFKGKGCVECNENGYRGRVALYEFFVVNEELADAINPDVKTGTLRELAARHGWRSLRDEAWTKVQNGMISIEEQQRLTRRINTLSLNQRL